MSISFNFDWPFGNNNNNMNNPDPYQLEAPKKIVMDVIKKTVSDSDYDQPFYIADLGDIVNKLRIWRSKLPRVFPFYAVKCNMDPIVLKLMVSLGINFDCASVGEIDMILKAGAQPSRIIYAHPVKSKSSLQHAAAVGVDLLSFDSEEELVKIKEIYPQARLVIRVRIKNVASAFPLNSKFGCEYEECVELLEIAKKLELNVVGTSFHVGGLCKEASAFTKALKLCRQVFDKAEDLGFHFSILDIGGGFWGNPEAMGLFDKMCNNINCALDDYFPQQDNLQIIAEPGCYFVCSAFTLCTTVIGKRMVKEYKSEDDGSGKSKSLGICEYHLNEGVYGSFPIGFDLYGVKLQPIFNQSKLRDSDLKPSKVWGMSCCSTDCIYENCLLPDIEVGEYIVFENMGAYTLCLASNFNGFEKTSTRYVYISRNMYDKQFIPVVENKVGSVTGKFINYICSDDSNIDMFKKG